MFYQVLEDLGTQLELHQPRRSQGTPVLQAKDNCGWGLKEGLRVGELTQRMGEQTQRVGAPTMRVEAAQSTA